MSIMDHFGYTTRPLVEFNLSIYTDRASFLGWLSHMNERRRLAITLDPAASEPARFKNKRVQASGDMIREESEPEVVPISPPSTSRSSSTAAKSSKSQPQWSQPDLSKNKTKIKHHFVKITSLFSKNKTHFSRTNTHIFLLFLHKIPFTYTVSIPLIKVYNF